MKPGPYRGRAATLNPDGRYLQTQRESEPDGWFEDPGPAPKTVVTVETARSLITRNDAPDIPFRQSINPYRGCEHGCIYCYARPSHAWQDLSPGLDFETRLFAKTNAVECLRRELARPGYVPDWIALGSNTDVYQPIERHYRLTRALLEILAECRHPVGIVTKSALIERDLDLLQELARFEAVSVYISLDTLDDELARKLDPRAAAPHRRLQTLATLAQAGIPTGVLVAPVIPWLTDHEIESTLQAAKDAGAREASYTLLRLPFELAELFDDWLQQHFPQKREHILARLADLQGKHFNAAGASHQRMSGRGVFAALIQQRFELACRRLQFAAPAPLSAAHFRPPRSDGQLSLF